MAGMVESIGPYRVYERLGVGGMGEVYKAYDDRLDRWVAIKRIRPDREDAEDNRERFKREARATARLNHPSIVHLYGIFQEGDSDCIVMEYVEGRTLDRILDGGTLDPLRVATLGHEIASGLAEAHQNGILHRDLKAENIIITPEGRSKILDFGLARPILRDELDPVLTDKGQLVGTSRSMSPEYVGGDEIDHRSDLFSLGVLLYECLTAQSPFKAHNTLATLKQVMLHRQTPVSEINPDVPGELSGLIDALLEKEPEDRPQSAADVARAFGRLTGRMSSGTLDRPSASEGFSVAGGALGEPGTSSTVGRVEASSTAAIERGSRTDSSFGRLASETVLDLRPRRKWITGLVVIGVLLALAFFLGSLLQKEDSPPEVAPLPEGQTIRILLGEFENATGEPIYDEGLHQALRVGLEQSRFIRTLSPSQVRDALRRMQKNPDAEIDRELGVELARRENTDRLVLGQIQRYGKTYKLFVEVVAPGGDATTFSNAAVAESQDEIIAQLDELASSVRRHLGESAEELADSEASLEKVTTANFEALRAYSLAVAHVDATEVPEEQVTLLKRAIRLDPNFAMAHARLVAAYANLGRNDLAQRHAELALANAERLTEQERFYIDGWIARWQGTTEDQIEVWSLMGDLHPDNYLAHYNLGLTVWLYQNDFARARDAFERAAEVAIIPAELSRAELFGGICQLALGQWDGLEERFRRLVFISPEPLADLYVARRDYAAATSLMEESDDEILASLVAARLELDRGRIESAFESYARLTESIDRNTSPGDEFEWMNALLGRAETARILARPRELDRSFELAFAYSREIGRAHV